MAADVVHGLPFYFLVRPDPIPNREQSGSFVAGWLLNDPHWRLPGWQHNNRENGIGPWSVIVAAYQCCGWLISVGSRDRDISWEDGRMMSPSDYESLSREERIRRIGAILGKAVTLRLERERAAREGGGEVPPAPDEARPSGHELSIPDVPDEPLASDELTLMRKVAMLGHLHPRDASAFFGSSRTTAYRRLQRLERGGWLVRHGQGKASRYHLTDKAHSALKRMKRIVRDEGAGDSGQ
jgi:hypothetical protein